MATPNFSMFPGHRSISDPKGTDMRIFLTVLGLASLVLAGNALQNGDFEKGLDGWTVWGALVSPEHHGGKSSCMVHLAAPAWAGASRILEIPKGSSSALVAGWLRSDSLRGGKENWERGRLSVEFFGAKGDTLGGYPPAVGQVRGHEPWTRMERTYSLPEGATTLKLGCELGNATGTLYCDDLSVEFLN
jgi:hypothetical protein